MDDNQKQTSDVSGQSLDKNTTEETSINEEVSETTETQSDTDSSVIAGPVESEINSAKSQIPDRGSQIPDRGQSSQDEDSTKIATEPEAPRNDEQEPSKLGNPNARWYVVHTYSGHENKVAVTLKQRVESEHLQEKILDVLVPMQDKIEIKGGKKATIKEKIFPGYILVKMVLDDQSWLAVRTTQGVTSFVGIGNKPTPISDAEVQTIVKFTQSQAPVYKQVFQANDTVKIVDGPFSDFIGKIDSVDSERGKVKVLVSIFGRETPVELDFLQVTKI